MKGDAAIRAAMFAAAMMAESSVGFGGIPIQCTPRLLSGDKADRKRKKQERQNKKRNRKRT